MRSNTSVTAFRSGRQPAYGREPLLTTAVVDLDPFGRRWLTHGLAAAGGFIVVGEAGDQPEALFLIAEHQPDVALVGSLAGLDPADVCARLAALWPRPRTRLVVVSPVLDPPFVARSLVAGASAFLAVGVASDEMARTLRRAALSRTPDGRRRERPAVRPFFAGSFVGPDRTAA